MERHNISARVVLAVLCVIFLGGLVQLNRASLSSSYPNFSSLHGGPSGAKLLWEGLARTAKISQQRSYRPLEEMHLTGRSVFYLGVAPNSLLYADETFFRTAERVANDGNRLILGITDDTIGSDEKDRKDPLLSKRWNVRLIQSKAKDHLVSIEAHSPWQPLVEAGVPPILEQKFGAGSIVLLPHASRISNAALAKDEKSRELIPKLIANYHAVVFDEAHFGIIESGSIAGLARRYRLQGLLIGFLVLAAFFLWNRSIVFPPIGETDGDRLGLIAGNDTRSTLVSLLARHIPPEDLLKICIAEWNRMRPDQKIIGSGDTVGRDPVADYRNIQENLQGKKTWKV